MPTETKPAWQSKTLIVNALMAITAIVIPSVSVWIAANPTMTATIFTGVNMVLRLLTKKPVDFFS